MSQKTKVSGTLTGKVATAVKEVQFICDGGMQRFEVDRQKQTFAGELRLSEPQFVEIKSGNNKPQFRFLLPNEPVGMTIDKPTLPVSVTKVSNAKVERLQRIFDVYFDALREQGLDTEAREWQTLLYNNPAPLDLAEKRLKEELSRNAAFVSAYPSFKRDVNLFMKGFRNYVSIDRMTLPEIEKALEDVRKSELRRTSVNIPYHREYLTDLTNAYAARTLEKYGMTLDYIKQRHIPQYIAAEAIERYVPDSTFRNHLYGEKLKVELPTNGVKNGTYVDFLMAHSGSSVKDAYRERIDILEANRLPDLNAPRKRAYDFMLHDSTGKAYRLDDFKGKLVFVDFWASWCAPCKAQIPYQKELEKAYAGKAVVFLSVSLDRSKPAWLKAVKDEDLHGYILHAENDFRNEFPKAYGVESIPRYMLIDAAGNVISDNMMKPQNKKEIKTIFDEELYADRTQEILERHFRAIGAEKLRQNGLYLEYRQSVMTFSAQNKTRYRYPKSLLTINRFESDEKMRLSLGDDFFNERYMLMQGDSISTNITGQNDQRRNWVSKVPGFELFLRSTVGSSVVRFAEEDGTGMDSAYVLKIVNGSTTEKYHINKRTLMLDRIVTSSPVEPRKGSGLIESFVAYEDFRSVEGVMIPFRSNLSNITSVKVEKAEVRPILDEEFRR